MITGDDISPTTADREPMTANTSYIIRQLSVIAIRELGEKKDVTELVRWLIESGLLKRPKVVKYLVRHKYLKAIQQKSSVKQHLKESLANEFNISIKTVNNIVDPYDNQTTR